MDRDHSLLGGILELLSVRTAFAATIRGQKFRDLGHRPYFYKQIFS